MTGTPQDLSALARFETIGLTTNGRRSGRQSRIEIWWFHIDGCFVVTGTPGPRDWYANVRANPAVVVHTPLGDCPGRAVVVEDPEFRRRVLTDPATRWYTTQAELDDLVATSPMVVIEFD